MHKMFKKSLMVFLVTGLVIIIELCLLASFYYSISLDSLLFHLRYYQTLLSASWPRSIGFYLLVWTIVGSAVVFKLLSRFRYSVQCKIMVSAFAAVFLWLGWSLDVFSYVRSSKKSDEFYNQYYQQPVAKFKNGKHPNLILLFLESVENGFMNNVISEGNWLPELSRRLKYGYSFKNYIQTSGTWWTMGATVGTLCGIPLSLPLEENLVYDEEYFLPGAVCLSDILAENGYELFYIKGSSVVFAGLDIFLSNHKFSAENIAGLRQLASQIPLQEVGEWGFRDVNIYPIFKRKIVELSQKKKPFFAIMQTIDTHSPFNEPSPHCEGSSKNIADVFKCADKQSAEFIDWFKQQPFAEDTVLVVIGDHLFMEKFWKKSLLQGNKQRTIFNLFINSRVKPRGGTNRQFTPLDMFPSLLESLGMDIPEQRAGLGVSIFSPQSKPTLVEQMGIEELNHKLKGRSEIYKSFLK